MKKFIRIICLILTLAALTSFAGCSGSGDVPTGFKLASNEVCDFDFVVPEAWTVSMSQGTVSAYATLDDPSSISVMPGELEFNYTSVSEWWKDYMDEIEAMFEDVTVISETAITLGGTPGMSYVFTAKLPGDVKEGETKTVYKYEITAVIRYSRLYMMTYTSTEKQFAEHETVVAAVKEYFKFH